MELFSFTGGVDILKSSLVNLQYSQEAYFDFLFVKNVSNNFRFSKFRHLVASSFIVIQGNLMNHLIKSFTRIFQIKCTKPEMSNFQLLDHFSQQGQLGLEGSYERY